MQVKNKKSGWVGGNFELVLSARDVKFRGPRFEPCYLSSCFVSTFHPILQISTHDLLKGRRDLVGGGEGGCDICFRSTEIPSRWNIYNPSRQVPCNSDPTRTELERREIRPGHTC